MSRIIDCLLILVLWEALNTSALFVPSSPSSITVHGFTDRYWCCSLSVMSFPGICSVTQTVLLPFFTSDYLLSFPVPFFFLFNSEGISSAMHSIHGTGGILLETAFLCGFVFSVRLYLSSGTPESLSWEAQAHLEYITERTNWASLYPISTNMDLLKSLALHLQTLHHSENENILPNSS